MTNKVLCLHIINSCNSLLKFQDKVDSIGYSINFNCNILDGVSYER